MAIIGVHAPESLGDRATRVAEFLESTTGHKQPVVDLADIIGTRWVTFRQRSATAKEHEEEERNRKIKNITKDTLNEIKLEAAKAKAQEQLRQAERDAKVRANAAFVDRYDVEEWSEEEEAQEDTAGDGDVIVRYGVEHCFTGCCRFVRFRAH